MDAHKILQEEKGGFDFSNCKRNTHLEAAGFPAKKAMKTGTTICGVVFKDGVVLGADTRATEGPIVADKNCEKIHYIADNIFCCGAGTSADTESVTNMISAGLELHRLQTGTEPRVCTALQRLKQKLFQYQGHISAALVLGGVDHRGAHLHTVYPHGSTDSLPYATMGSGSLAAMAVMEAGYADDMDEEQAIDLVDRAIQAGIWNDLGSGSNVDVCVISRKYESGRKYLRNYKTPNERAFRADIAGYRFPKGTTAWLEETKRIFKSQIVVEEKKEEGDEAMQ